MSLRFRSGLLLVRRDDDRWLFPAGAAIFAAAFATLAGSSLPYILPFSLTLQ